MLAGPGGYSGYGGFDGGMSPPPGAMPTGNVHGGELKWDENRKVFFREPGISNNEITNDLN